MNIIQEATRKLDALHRRGTLAKSWLSVGPPSGGASTLAGAEATALPRPGPRPDAVIARLPLVARVGAGDAGSRPTRPPAAVELDLARIEGKGWIGADYAPTRLAEEFRHLKRPLLENVRRACPPVERPWLIMVTSAVGGEGKTFTAINLAMSLALELQTRVLLVDADVIRPGVAGYLGIREGKGLMDLLLDRSLALDDVVMGTNIARLSVLLSGTHSDMSAELFGSAAMDSRLDAMRGAGRADIVVLDAPPILPTNEAKLLAARVGQVVLVVEAGRTPRALVAQALDELKACPVVLPLLNRSTVPAGASSYGSYGSAPP